MKLIGSISANPSTGQLTATFPQNPQAPFSSLQLSLKSGPSAPLTNPPACGTATTSWSISSYVNPTSPVTGSSSYQVGGNCAESSQFTPTLSAGSQGLQAGSSSPFVFTIARPDGQQEISGVPQVTLPLGLTAAIRGVTQCASAAAAAAVCPASSQIGTATVEAGSGTEPYVLQNQPVYLTGPYEGAPFGLAVTANAVAGPFDLGTVVVRQAVYVNPTTAQLTVKSDALPTMLGGVPLDLRAISLDIDRPAFMRAPTSCQAESLSATLTSAPLGQAADVLDEDIGYATASTATLSEPYQAQGCASLPFKPTFKASTQAKVSRRAGASLKVLMTQGSGEANLHEIEVQLPKLLPSRDATLNLACTEQQFDTDPAGCPAASKVGTAIVHTPILNATLTGPAILVSHGHAAFPNLELVLQGEGVTIDVTGTITIKDGITFTRMKTIPDEPISSVELNLPEGEHSILGAPSAKGDLCGRTLAMPTALVGQNGARIERRIEPQGCPTSLAIRSHDVEGRTLKLELYAPSAGKIEVSGRGLKTKIAQASASDLLTVEVDERRAGALTTTAKVRFTPPKGKRRASEAKSIAVRFKR